jgi:predicted NAD/FAD-dependent oxidoreductase
MGRRADGAIGEVSMRVAVVGAGLAGLACAGALQAGGHAVVVFEKSRGVGGRMATRRVRVESGEIGFDHGAQYFTARDPGFGAVVAGWKAAGLAASWPAAGSDAWVGMPTMNAPVRLLAEGLEVRRSLRVDALERRTDGWHLGGDGFEAGPYDAVVVGLPAEQAAVLLRPVSQALSRRAADTPSDPCWTVMASFPARVPIAADVVRNAGAIVWAARDSAKPGRGGPERWVLQANPEWSREHLEDAPEGVEAALPMLLGAALGVDVPKPQTVAAHRWRYARSGREGSGHLWDAAAGLGVCGDWLLGARVESAWLSGTGLAAAIGRAN